MDADVYRSLAMRTLCPQSDAYHRILDLPQEIVPLLHASTGLPTEVGEFCSLVERQVWFGEDVPVEEFEKEIGDIMWYVALACRAMGLNLNVVLERNLAKLRKRFPEGFDEQAVRHGNREDESGGIDKDPDQMV